MKINLTKMADRRPVDLSALNRLPFKAGTLATLTALWATYNYKGGYVAGTNTGMPSTTGLFNVVDIKLDFAAIAAARSAAGQTALAAADILELVGVKAATWVPAVFVQTITAEGETATVHVGDGADPDGFITVGDVNAVGWLSSLITTAYSLATAGGKIYTADDTIDMTLNTAAFNVAVLHLLAPMVDLRAYR